MKLYAFGPTRSVRPKWTLQELGIKYELIDAFALKNKGKFNNIHPLNKIPALEHNGRILFESVAISNYLADLHPEKKLIPEPGSWERALHNQWSCFALAELEAWVWSNAKHTFLYPEEKRIAKVVDLNNEEFRKSAAVVENVLNEQQYILGNYFSLTDINLSYSLNWGRTMKIVGDFPNINRYLDDLHKRPHNTLVEQTEFFKNRS